MSLPDNAHPECKELGMCVLREYKGYMPCNECSGSCSLADSTVATPSLNPAELPKEAADGSATTP